MIESIIPCIKVTQVNGMIGCDIYIEEGEKIKFITNNKEEISGTFLFIELSQYEEYDDILHIELDSGNIKTFRVSEIEKIID